MSTTRIQHQRRERVLLPSDIFGLDRICKLCEGTFAVATGYSNTFLHVCGECIEHWMAGEVQERRRKAVSIESVDRWDGIPTNQ